jgi:hypothetical protein
MASIFVADRGQYSQTNDSRAASAGAGADGNESTKRAGS